MCGKFEVVFCNRGGQLQKRQHGKTEGTVKSGSFWHKS